LAQFKQGIAQGAARRYSAVNGSSTVAKIAADLRPSAHFWWPAVAAGSQRAYSLGSCALGQTDGRIALFLNAP